MKNIKYLLVALALSGCVAQPSLYSWGKYENSLYDFYKKPEGLSEYIGHLEATVERGEKNNNVAPGIYAETGYAYFTAGNTKLAIEYFEKEKTKWPEAASLMDVMISNASKIKPSAVEEVKNDG